jgi:hypothetical protein
MDCGSTENTYCCPVVDAIVIAPASSSETVPDVYVVSEFAIPEIPVCAPPAFAPEIVIAFPFCERVLLFPPASVTVPEDASASAPAVFPSRVSATRFCVWTD